MNNIKKKLQTYCDRINEILDNGGSKYKFVVSDNLTEHQGIVIRYSNEDKESEW